MPDLKKTIQKFDPSFDKQREQALFITGGVSPRCTGLHAPCPRCTGLQKGDKRVRCTDKKRGFARMEGFSGSHPPQPPLHPALPCPHASAYFSVASSFYRMASFYRHSLPSQASASPEPPHVSPSLNPVAMMPPRTLHAVAWHHTIMESHDLSHGLAWQDLTSHDLARPWRYFMCDAACFVSHAWLAPHAAMQRAPHAAMQRAVPLPLPLPHAPPPAPCPPRPP